MKQELDKINFPVKNGVRDETKWCQYYGMLGR